MMILAAVVHDDVIGTCGYTVIDVITVDIIIATTEFFIVRHYNVRTTTNFFNNPVFSSYHHLASPVCHKGTSNRVGSGAAAVVAAAVAFSY